jgi:hypothetical protein
MRRLIDDWKKHKKICIILLALSSLISVILHFFGFFFIQVYFYLKNGNIIDLEHYYIELPFPKWIISGSDDFGYVASAKNNFSYTMSAAKNKSLDIAISRNVGQPNDPDYELVSTVLCWNAESTMFIDNNGITGIKYLYSNLEGKYVMLFLSDDRLFYLIITSYDPTEENEKYLDLLLNSVRKKDNV